MQLRAMLGLREDWPFTSAPMFARYQAAGDPLVEFRVFLVPARGDEVELDTNRDLGLGDLGFRRQFFTRYYGSADAPLPSKQEVQAAEQQFRQRLREWLARVAVVAARRRGQELSAVRLEAWVRQASQVDRVVVASFAPHSGKLNWQPAGEARR